MVLNLNPTVICLIIAPIIALVSWIVISFKKPFGL